MTQRQPTPRQLDDAQFGFDLCKNISKLDIGQALALFDKDVIAVEAMEGTDAMILRAGELCRTKGWTTVKVSNAKQDKRADVPTIGMQTIENLAKAGCGCLVLEVGEVMMLDKPKLVARAEQLGVSILGMQRRPNEAR
ncbi:MAG: LpxI family protein [Tepidisphaeraceae bacterium]